MLAPSEHKTVQSRVRHYAQEIGRRFLLRAKLVLRHDLDLSSLKI